MISAREEYELSQDVVSFRPHAMATDLVGRSSRERSSYYNSSDDDDDDDDDDEIRNVFDDFETGAEREDEGSKEVAEAPDAPTVHVLEYPEGGKLAYLTLFGCFVGLVAELGLWNTTGAIESYVAAHVLVDESGIAISMIFALFAFIVMFGSMLSGVVLDRYGGTALCYAGSVLTTGGLMATANCTELYQFILAFSITSGIGCSLLTPPFVTSIGHFFNKRRGMALAIAMPGASLGGVVWPLLCRSLYTKVGFPWTIRTLAFCIGALLFTASACIHDRHEEIGRLRELNEGAARVLSLREKLHELVDVSIFREATFMALTVALFLNEFALLMVSTYIPSYAVSKGYSESFSLVALTVFNAAGVLGRIVPTLLSDRYGNFNLIILMSAVMSLSVWILWLPLGQHRGAFIAFTVVFGFAVAGTMALTPLCTSAISEPKDFGRRYGTAYCFVSFCNLVSLPVGMALTQTAAGFDAMVAFAGATCTLGTVCFLYTRYRVGGGLNRLRI